MPFIGLICYSVETCFEHAEDFIPERWGTAPQLVKDSTGFRAFGLGGNVKTSASKQSDADRSQVHTLVLARILLCSK